VLCSRKDDFIYADELEAYEKSGVLSQLHVAFSRDGASKVRQHSLEA
jgi:sulfite reductase alpha subunit-like flavoprotein